MSPRPSSSLTLEHVLLALLDQKPMHGYELYQELCALQGISLIWNIKQSLLYAILDKLERNGFLSSHLVPGETYPPRNYFHLTELGKNALQKWINSPVRRARDLRQEFLAKLIIARRYGKSKSLELIHIQEQACQTWLNELEANVPARDQDHTDEWLVYSFRINRVKGVLEWLNECSQEIDHLLEGLSEDR
jgi:PadR family transcriptional regulator, regulatory protein AphA